MLLGILSQEITHLWDQKKALRWCLSLGGSIGCEINRMIWAGRKGVEEWEISVNTINNKNILKCKNKNNVKIF